MFYFMSLYYSNGFGPGYVSAVCAIIFVSFMVFRPCRMFYVYVKTGTLDPRGNTTLSQYDTFIDNLGTAHTWTGIKKLVHDLYMNPVPDSLMYDVFMFLFSSLALLLLGGVLPIIIAIWLVIYGIIRLAKHLRKRVEMKEEFVDRLKGN